MFSAATEGGILSTMAGCLNAALSAQRIPSLFIIYLFLLI